MNICTNVYEDRERAVSYAELEYPGTYYLAFRDIPELIRTYATAGDRALDFGCGAGRSARFLKRLGFHTVGADISAAMLEQARAYDPNGDYRLVGDGDLSGLQGGQFHLILSAFTFDNIPGEEHKLRILRELRRRTAPEGTFINLVSSPEIYLHEWASFTTRQFPENRQARDGDPVRIVMTDVPDRRPVVDIRCSDELYRRLYRAAGYEIRAVHRPLGRPEEPYEWKAETRVAPWTLYVLSRGD
jgi:SAM-dependent methyltransferase